MVVNRDDFVMAQIPEESPDSSWLEQEGFEARLKEYREGGFYFVGIRAVIELRIPSKQGGYFITQTITSPGLWNIESDSGADYFKEVFEEESNILAEMLEQLGITLE